MARSKNPKSGRPARRRPAKVSRSSKASEKMAANLKGHLPLPGSRALIYIVRGLAVLAAILIIITWFYKVYASPRNVFLGMLSNNLSTLSVMKQSNNSSGSASNEEITQLSFNDGLRIHDIKRISENSTHPSTKLTLEAIGTPKADYQRYSHIQRPNQKGSIQDYSQIYGMWLKNGGSPNAQPQIVGSTLFGATLFGNLSPSDKARLMPQLQRSYKVDFDKTTKRTTDGRRTYLYSVVVHLKTYAQASRVYAKILRLPLAEQINPANYRQTDNLQVIFNVDVLSRQLVSIDYLNNNVKEKYTGYGLVSTVELPARTVDARTFQNAINKIR